MARKSNTQAVAADLADRIGAAKAAIKQHEAVIKAARERLEEMGVRDAAGVAFRVAFTEQDRETLDTKAVRDAFPPAALAPFLKHQTVAVMNVTATGAMH